MVNQVAHYIHENQLNQVVNDLCKKFHYRCLNILLIISLQGMGYP